MNHSVTICADQNKTIEQGANLTRSMEQYDVMALDASISPLTAYCLETDVTLSTDPQSTVSERTHSGSFPAATIRVRPLTS